MVKAIIFDLDGVIVDSFDAVTKFLQNILVASGYPVPSLSKIKTVFHLPRQGAFMVSKNNPILVRKV